MAALIDGALADGGVVFSPLYANVAAVGDPWSLRNFVRVGSEFYPQLATYYDERIAAWFAENVPADDAGDEGRSHVADAPESSDE